METKELIQALRSDAEWAHTNEWETPIPMGDNLEAAADALEARLAEAERLNSEMQLENTQLESDGKCREDDGCPTENAALRREWRKLTEQLAITTNIPIDRLEAICAAEKDGRLVTLPCKVGDKIYHICGENYGSYEDEIETETVDHFVITDGGDVLIKSDPWDRVICSPEQLGKITQNNTFDDWDGYYLTRAEAEEALKESKSTSLKLGAENG